MGEECIVKSEEYGIGPTTYTVVNYDKIRERLDINQMWTQSLRRIFMMLEDGQSLKLTKEFIERYTYDKFVAILNEVAGMGYAFLVQEYRMTGDYVVIRQKDRDIKFDIEFIDKNKAP